MGCFSSRVKLSNCTSWTDLNEKIKVYDQSIKDELKNLNRIKDTDLTPTQHELKTFYLLYSPWEPLLVDGKVFDPKIAEYADNVYFYLDEDKGEANQEKLCEDSSKLLKALERLEDIDNK